MSFRTGGHRSPDALTPLSSRQTSGALSNATVDDEESQGAFGDIVGGIDLGMGDRGEVFLAEVSKAFRRCSGIPPACVLLAISKNRSRSFSRRRRKVSGGIFSL